VPVTGVSVTGAPPDPGRHAPGTGERFGVGQARLAHCSGCPANAETWTRVRVQVANR